MTGVATPATRPSVRRSGSDVIAAFALFAVALLPIYLDRASLPGSDAAGAGVRLQVAWETHTRRAIAAGELPLWNPYHFAGRPHLADPHTLALYPPHVLLRFLPIGLFFIVSFALHGWVFGLGAYAAARLLGAPRAGALAAAVGVMLLGIVVPGTSAGYTPAIYEMAWLPLLVALALNAAGKPGLLPPVSLVLVAALAVTAGGRSPLYAAAAIAACYLFVSAWPADRGATTGRAVLRLAIVLGLAAGLSAFQLVPSARMLAAAAWMGGVGAPRAAEAAPGKRAAGANASLASLAAPGAPRVLSTCAGALDPGLTLSLGIPGVDGGGTVAADYQRLVDLAAGGPERPADALDMARPSIRRDLLGLLNAGAVVGCAGAGAGPAEEAGHVQIARAPQLLARAFWTCAPRRVGRQELDYRLQNYRYDDTLTLYPANPVVHIRWAAGLDPAARDDAELTLRVRPRQLIEDRTWQYDLLDGSRTNLAAIVGHRLVEDTAGFDRGSLELPQPPAPPSFDERQSEWLIGSERCDEVQPAAIEQIDTADGRLVATVDAPRDGVVVISESYHPDRTATVDGARVETLKVNLALTAIPVSAGQHRIELRASASPVWLGAGITVLTLMAWIAAVRVRSR